MLSLFTNYDCERNFPITMPSAMDYILRTYQRDIDRVVEYYKTGVRAVNHQHLLSRIIGTVSAPTHYPLESFLNAVDARAPFVAKTFMLTSAINRGSIHYGVFGNPSNPEVILNIDEPFDYFDDWMTGGRWKDMTALKCIEHQNSSLQARLLNGTTNNSSVGLSVYTLNIPMLMFQFRCFVHDQLSSKDLQERTVLDKTHFVAMYVLPNAIRSDMNLQLINRFQNKVSGRPMDRCHTSLPIAVSDYSDKMDRALEQIVEALTNKRASYESYLRHIPAFYGRDAQEVLQLPTVAPTRQVQWSLIVSRLKHIRTLFTIGGDVGRKANIPIINEFRLDLKQMLRDSQLSGLLGYPSSYLDFESVFDEVMGDIKAIGIAR